MGKKISAVMLALLLCMIGTACDGSVSRQDAYTRFIENADFINQQDGLYLNIFGSLSTEYQESVATTGISANYTAQVDGGKKVENAVLSFSDTSGEFTDYNFLTDGSRYCYGDDETVEEVSKEDFEKITAFKWIETSFEQDAVRKATAEKSDTATTYTLVLYKNKSQELATKLLEAISVIDTASVPVEFAIDSIECSVAVNENDEPVSFSYSLNTNMTAEGETMAASYSLHYSIYQTGDEVTVPAVNLDDYLGEAEAAE